MKIVDSHIMGEIDRKSIEDYGIPSMILMENAGIRVWYEFKNDHPQLSKSSKIVFLAGKGNNGGDACVMARQAFTEEFTNISLLSWGTDVKTDGTGQKKICHRLHIPILQWEGDRNSAEKLISESDFIIDGLAGTGLKGGARPELSEIIEAVNRAEGNTIALDIPSGLGDDFRPGFSVVAASITYTIGLPLISLYSPAGRVFCGRIKVIPICFPREEIGNPDIPGELIVWEDVISKIPFPATSAYKGTRGHLHIYAGSSGYSGAAWLAANAAVRSLPGLVTLFTDNRVYPSLAASCRSVMVRPWELPAIGDKNREAEAGCRTLLIGPGWGTDQPDLRKNWLEEILSREDFSGVLDADGLTIWGEGGDFETPAGGWIFTPHPGELARLTGKETGEIMKDPLPVILEYAIKWNVTLVLKAHVVYLALPDGRFFIVDGMNPALGTGGSGDLLSGIIAGLLAAGASPEDAALIGICLHQEAGRLGKERSGWFAAEDLIPLIPEILKNAENSQKAGGAISE
ncbi:MAG: NAD(P)H-hydrate dehydratase [Spirochaetales bacterium]|nr:NAD(P)H-hydrate dehydratase [Spirochaetales bacterium]